eukprot:7100045-Alexandrium_andersonii.AAC.1
MWSACPRALRRAQRHRNCLRDVDLGLLGAVDEGLFGAKTGATPSELDIVALAKNFMWESKLQQAPFLICPYMLKANFPPDAFPRGPQGRHVDGSTRA